MAKIEVFSSGPQCTHCTHAKAILTEQGLSYDELDVVNSEAHLAELIRRLPRARAMPQIFIDGHHIGSVEDLESLVENGKLRELTGG